MYRSMQCSVLCTLLMTVVTTNYLMTVKLREAAYLSDNFCSKQFINNSYFKEKIKCTKVAIFHTLQEQQVGLLTLSNL